MSTSLLLDGSASHNFIAASQVTKYNNSIWKLLLYLDNPIKVPLADNYSVLSHQIVQLSPALDDGTLYTVKSRVVPTLNYTINLRIALLNKLNPNINWKNHTTTLKYPQLTSFIPHSVAAALPS